MIKMAPLGSMRRMCDRIYLRTNKLLMKQIDILSTGDVQNSNQKLFLTEVQGYVR